MIKKDEFLECLKNTAISFAPMFVPATSLALLTLANECFNSSAKIRQDKWNKEIIKRIANIDKETEQKMIRMSNLASIVTTVQRNALEDVEENKISFYVNTIINSIKKENLQDTQKHIFLNMLRDFTLLHIKILKRLKFIQETMKEPVEQNRPGYIIEYFQQNFPEIKIDENFYYIIADLSNKNCCMISEGTGFDDMNKILTKYGNDFLEFINTSLDD